MGHRNLLATSFGCHKRGIFNGRLQANGKVENSDFSDIADFFSPTFINPCFRFSPLVNIENLDLKKSKIFNHPSFRYSL